MLEFPIAIQLYSVRNEMEADFVATLKQLKKMGYDGVELVGMYGRKPEEIHAICTEIGLVPVSVHVGIDEIMNWSTEQFQKYVRIGCRQVVLSYIPPEYRYGTDQYDELLKHLREMGEYGRKIGVPLAYHNHDFEFAKVDEEYVLDMLYRKIPSDTLLTELDTCWIHVGGENPVDYIRKYSNCMLAVHLKDYQISEDGLDICMCPLGQGLLDFQDILFAVKETSTEWLVVEQDYPNGNSTPMECARMSIEYLKSL